MRMKKISPLITLVLAVMAVLLSKNLAAAAPDKSPKIEFETKFYDFGKITASGKLSGVFKFKNTGDGVLKLEPPQPSCDCTEAKVKPDILAPGETGEILYTIKLERALNGQRHIIVRSNDPQTPMVQLTMQLDFTPLYAVEPSTLWMVVPAGKSEAQRSFTVTRIDGKPLKIDRITSSQDWITAAFDPSVKPDDSSGKINVTVRRPSGAPEMINASIQLWSGSQPDPVQTMPVMGDILAEIAASPSRLYWVIPDFGKSKADYPAESLTRTIQLKSILGHQVALTNATSNIEGMSVKIVPKVAGQTFDLVLNFDQLPHVFTNGTVSVETSLASLPKLEVPVTVSVPE